MNTQDSQSELEGLVDRIHNNLTLDEGVEAIEAYVTARVKEAERTVEVKGNVKGNIEAGNSIHCGDVGGDVNAGNSVHCGDIKGSVDAGNSIYRK